MTPLKSYKYINMCTKNERNDRKSVLKWVKQLKEISHFEVYTNRIMNLLGKHWLGSPRKR